MQRAHGLTHLLAATDVKTEDFPQLVIVGFNQQWPQFQQLAQYRMADIENNFTAFLLA